jgi:hypothetical protein
MRSTSDDLRSTGCGALVVRVAVGITVLTCTSTAFPQIPGDSALNWSSGAPCSSWIHPLAADAPVRNSSLSKGGASSGSASSASAQSIAFAVVSTSATMCGRAGP